MNYFKRIFLDVKLKFLRYKSDKIKRYQKSIGHKWRDDSWYRYVELGERIEDLRLRLESDEYLEFYHAKNKIHDYRLALQDNDKIPRCTPRPLKNYGEKFMIEQNNYLLFEIYEGKHNEFLQRIIDRTKEKKDE